MVSAARAGSSVARRALLTEIVDVAVRADEAGFPVLSVALQIIVRSARQAPSTCRYLVNGMSCILDSVESAHRDRRRGAKRQPFA